MDGETATRIYLEVLKGKRVDPSDALDEAEYRSEIRKSVDKIALSGGMLEPPKEWL